MRKQLLFTLLFLVSLGLLAGQIWICELSFDGVYPYEHDRSQHALYNVIPENGDGYLVQGYSVYTVTVPIQLEIWTGNVFWKVDESGNVIWRKSGLGSKPFRSMAGNGVDRYYFTSKSDLNHYGSMLIVADNELNELGRYYYYADFYDMQYTDDGLVFIGKSASNNGLLVVKTDFQFNQIWQVASSTWSFEFDSIEAYGDGWICSSRERIINISAAGETLWSYDSYPQIHEALWDCAVSSDNRVFLLGNQNLWEMDMVEHELCLVAADIPYDYQSYRNRSIATLPNGNIVYTGRTTSGTILHCYSPDGVYQWSRSYDTSYWITILGQGSKNLLVTPDGNIIFLFQYNRFGGGVPFLVKADSDGNVVANDDPVVNAPVASIAAYPQPANSRLTLSIKSGLPGDMSFSIYNIKGQKLYTGEVGNHRPELSIDLDESVVRSMPNGIYLVNLKQKDRTVASCKVVIVK